MDNREWVCVDIETNGGNGPRGRVIEVAAIKVVDGQVVDTFQSLINPGGTIPHWITNLTGIDNNDLVHAPYFADIAEQLYGFMESSIFVAHNVLFDYSFLKREFAACGLTFRPKLFCTVKMSRALYPEHRGHSLEKIITRHNLSVAARHRAYDDARVLYDYMQMAIARKGIEAFKANVALQLKTKSLPPNVDEQIILSLPDGPGIYIFENDDGMPLYVGKSVSIRTRVRSHFTSATSIAKEMKMSLQSHNISFVSTETEIEALLLESAKIKELQPLFNVKLRRNLRQSILVKTVTDEGYMSISVTTTDISRYQNLAHVYGVYKNRTAAKNALEGLTRTYQLCPKLLGLEKSRGACFRYQLGLCRGACTGKESANSYNERAEIALERSRIETWPFGSKIAISISSTRSIIVDQWVIIGIIDTSLDDDFTPLDNGFDLDTYKILRSYIRTHAHHITRIDDMAKYFD